MRVFLCEFVTGGGMRGEDLPRSLAREGAMMRDALAADLADIPGVEVLTSHDDRLTAPPGVASDPVEDGADVWSLWARRAREADVAWAIAPEIDGILARLTSLLRANCAEVVGPDDEAIRAASSKFLTAERLIAAGVPTPPVWWADEVPAGASGPFVVKPDDGAGCEATRLLDRAPASGDLPRGNVVQGFVAGDAASLTVLAEDGRARLLSANRQRVIVEHGVFRFRGVAVAAVGDDDGRLAALASDVLRALPGLAGIFGIDIVLAADGPVVIEVNPRLTTAYAGLREAIGVNPASLVAPFSRFASPNNARAPRMVEIAL